MDSLAAHDQSVENDDERSEEREEVNEVDETMLSVDNCQSDCWYSSIKIWFFVSGG